MNALGHRPARRIADLIHSIRPWPVCGAGLYIGAADEKPTAAMTGTSVITDKERPCTSAARHPAHQYTKQLGDYLPHPAPMCRGSGPTTKSLPMAPAPCAIWWWMSSTLRWAPRGTESRLCLIRRLRDRSLPRRMRLVCVGHLRHPRVAPNPGGDAPTTPQIFSSSFEAARLDPRRSGSRPGVLFRPPKPPTGRGTAAGPFALPCPRRRGHQPLDIPGNANQPATLRDPAGRKLVSRHPAAHASAVDDPG